MIDLRVKGRASEVTHPLSLQLHSGVITPDSVWEETIRGCEGQEGGIHGDHFGRWLPQLGEVLIGNPSKQDLKRGMAGEGQRVAADRYQNRNLGTRGQATGQPTQAGALGMNPGREDASL